MRGEGDAADCVSMQIRKKREEKEKRTKDWRKKKKMRTKCNNSQREE